MQAGADLVDLGPAAPEQIMLVQARCPQAGVCAAGPPADLVTDLAAARASGAMAICAGLDAARSSGLPAGRLLVAVPPGLVLQARQAGWAVLVDADQAAAQERDGGPAGTAGPDAGAAALAIAALASWLGAAAVRTAMTGQARRALDMTAAIRGLRPPARAVRGLA